MAIDVVHLIGAGGHGRVVADALRRSGLDPEAIVMRDGKAGASLFGRPVQSPEIVAAMQDRHFHVAIGSAFVREKLHNAALAVGARALTIVHPRAIIADDVTLGNAVLIAAAAVIGPGSALGDATIVNHNAVVDHDCVSGSFCHVAPGATLGGGVVLGDRVMIGAGAVILPNLSIASDVVVGAGAVVLRSIEGPGTWVGNPAMQLK